eukprot:Polyplicarium_translucidae@DN2360_c0_g2_i2.p1
MTSACVRLLILCLLSALHAVLAIRFQPYVGTESSRRYQLFSTLPGGGNSLNVLEWGTAFMNSVSFLLSAIGIVSEENLQTTLTAGALGINISMLVVLFLGVAHEASSIVSWMWGGTDENLMKGQMQSAALTRAARHAVWPAAFLCQMRDLLETFHDVQSWTAEKAVGHLITLGHLEIESMAIGEAVAVFQDLFTDESLAIATEAEFRKAARELIGRTAAELNIAEAMEEMSRRAHAVVALTQPMAVDKERSTDRATAGDEWPARLGRRSELDVPNRWTVLGFAEATPEVLRTRPAPPPAELPPFIGASSLGHDDSRTRTAQYHSKSSVG